MAKLFITNKTLNRMLKQFTLNIGLIKMVQVLGNLLFLNHIAACIWFLFVRKWEFLGLLTNLSLLGKAFEFYTWNLGRSKWFGRCWPLDTIYCLLLLGLPDSNNSRIWGYKSRNWIWKSFRYHVDDCWCLYVFICDRQLVKHSTKYG